MQFPRNPAFSTLAEFPRGGTTETPASPDGGVDPAEAAARVSAAADDGFQRGWTAGREEVQREFEKKMLDLRTQFDERVAQERQALQVGQADRLSGELAQGLRDVKAQIEEKIALLLKPWLKAELYERALSDLEGVLQRVAGEATTIHIWGPQPLVRRLAETLTDRDVKAVFAPGDDPHVSMTVDDTRIDADLSAWMQGLEAMQQ